MSDPHSPRPESKSVTRDQWRRMTHDFYSPQVADRVWDSYPATESRGFASSPEGIRLRVAMGLPAAEPASSAEARQVLANALALVGIVSENLGSMGNADQYDYDWPTTDGLLRELASTGWVIRSAGTPPASTPEAFDAAGFAAVVVQRDRMTELYGQCKTELAALRATPPEPVGGREALLVLSDAATPGPWEFEGLTGDGWAIMGDTPEPADGDDGTWALDAYGEAVARSREDAAFIVAAVNHVRAALQASPPTGVSETLDAGDDQCPERCLGIVGHAGPHQTSDYEPPLRIEHAAVDARDRELRAAIEALDCWLSGPSVVGIVHDEGLVTVGRDAVLALLDSAPADAG